MNYCPSCGGKMKRQRTRKEMRQEITKLKCEKCGDKWVEEWQTHEQYSIYYRYNKLWEE